jgi:cyclophilin family peptidyl-prolyl cis-trans isomerase
MDKETKVTYSVIAVLIVFLGGLAYFLQPLGASDIKATTDTTTTKTVQTKPLTDTQATKATTTVATTTMEDKKYTGAIITTNKGVIEVTFDKNKPLTVANFTKLATENFYNGVRFHRVIKNFMIQTGDPLSKDTANMASWGTGGPGYTFKDENVGNETYPQGTLAMANSGPNTNGSQFFIVTAADGYNPPTPAYTVFGHVTKGMETALAIQDVKTGAQDRPLEDVIIEKVEMK